MYSELGNFKAGSGISHSGSETLVIWELEKRRLFYFPCREVGFKLYSNSAIDSFILDVEKSFFSLPLDRDREEAPRKCPPKKCQTQNGDLQNVDQKALIFKTLTYSTKDVNTPTKNGYCKTLVWKTLTQEKTKIELKKTWTDKMLTLKALTKH